MIQIIDKTQCTGCTACASACPVGCIHMVGDTEGFLYPQVDRKKCIQCGVCLKTCPLATPHEPEIFSQAQAYAVKSRDEVRQMASSSGGVFSELAEYVFRQGGIVIGAAFQKDFSVAHTCVLCEADLAVLRGAKYVQSDIAQNYIAVREYLTKGKMVLFSGTPCQIAGLYRFLGGDHEKLITQDIICHGVPSPMVWKKYLEEQCRLEGSSTIRNINFRDKSTGWKKYSMQIEYENGKRYCVAAANNPMMKAFLKNLCLRPSCYACAFKQMVKGSDITLADFWGIEHVLPEWNDDKGISLVMLNSPKGRKLFSEIQSHVEVQEVDRTEAIKYNSSAILSAPRPDLRDEFMLCVETKSFGYAAEKYLKSSLWSRIKAKIKSFL